MGAADDEVSVQITADIDSLTEGMDGAADSANKNMGEIENSSIAAGEALDSSISEAAEKAKGKLEEVGEETINLGEKFEELHGSIKAAFEAGGILLAIEAIHKVAEALEETMERATQLNNMAEVLGVNVEQFQALELAANQAGVGMSMLSRTAIRLKTDLTDAREGSAAAEEKLFRLGITLEDIQNSSFGEAEALAKLADRLRDSSTATETMGAISKDFGARAAMVAEALKNYHGNLEDVAGVMSEVNGLSKEQIEQLHSMHAFWSQVGTTISNTTSKILLYGSAVLKAQADAEIAMSGGDTSDTDAIDKKTEAQTASATSQVDSIHKVTLAEVQAAQASIALAKSGTQAKVDAVIDYLEKVNEYYGHSSDAYKKALTEEQKAQQEFDDKQAEESVKAADQELKEFERLVAKKTEVTKKAASEMSKEWDKYFKDLTKADQEALKGTEETVTAETNAAEKILALELKSKQIDPSTYLAAEKNLIQERLQFQIQYYESLKQLYANDAAQLQQYDNAEAKATQLATQQMVAAQQKAAQETKTTWDAAMKPVERSFDTAIQTMVTSTHGFASSVKTALDSIVKGAFTTEINSMVHQWLTGETEKTAATTLANKVRLADTTASAAQTKAVNSTTATADIQTKAAQASAGAYAAIVGIPYVGPILAVAAMAAAEAVVMGLIGKISSAEGGMVVDHDQLAMVHEDEMILPSNISQGINEKILGKNPFGDAGSDHGGGGNNHYHFSALDSKSFDRYVKSQKTRNSLVDAVRKAGSRGKTLRKHQ